MKKAVKLYADRRNPDYANAVKEAVSAVEAAARIVLKDKSATLGQALRHLEKNDVVHPAFSKGVRGLYGWCSGTEVRHAKEDGQPDTSEPEPRFMLVTCSAIANFLLSRARV